jgi:hypothetical protein
VKAIGRTGSEKIGSRHAEGRPHRGAAFCMLSERKIQHIAGEVTVENARRAGRQGLSLESVNVLDKKQKKAYQLNYPLRLTIKQVPTRVQGNHENLFHQA